MAISTLGANDSVSTTLPWKILSALLAAIVLIPIVTLFLMWGTVGPGEQVIWEHLFSTKLDRLMLNTLILMLGVGTGVTLLGVSLAWLTSICEFPGGRWFDWALMLPLAIPGYVMAFVFLGLMNFTGPVQTALRNSFGVDVYFPNVQGPVAVIIVLSLVLYPYVYMLARSAFLSQGRSMMDSARILGLNPWQAFYRISVPIARPAIVAGVALALMETLADFGTVSVFNYDTFTTAIYEAWYGLFNLTVAAQLSSLLLLFVAVSLMMEKHARNKARYSQSGRSAIRRPYILKGKKAYLATGFCSLILMLGFLIPLARLISWCFEAGLLEVDDSYLGLLGRTLGLGAMAALATAVIALLLAYAKRLPGNTALSNWLAGCTRVATLGYALPGSVLAVGIFISFTFLDQTLIASTQSFFGVAARPVLAGGVFALVIAYCTRFLAVAFAPVESSLERISPTIIDAARSLGASPGRILREVYMPLLRPGLMTALLIVFIDVMKEMPATLIMRPFGWDTLAVRIYQWTAEGQWERAAFPAVTLIIAGLLPVMILIKSSRHNAFDSGK